MKDPIPIGSGANGQVFRVSSAEYGSSGSAIVKVFEHTDRIRMITESSARRLPVEIAILQRVRKMSTVVTLLESKSLVVDDRVYSAIVMKDLGEKWICLKDYTLQEEVVVAGAPSVVISMLRSTFASARLFWDATGMLHGDTKSENIMINTVTLQQRMLDFDGCVPMLGKGELTTVFTGTYASPEYLRNGAHNPCASEVFAIGCLGWDLFFGNTDFEKKGFNLKSRVGKEAELLGEELMEFFLATLNPDENERIDLKDLANLRLFDGIDLRARGNAGRSAGSIVMTGRVYEEMPIKTLSGKKDEVRLESVLVSFNLAVKN